MYLNSSGLHMRLWFMCLARGCNCKGCSPTGLLCCPTPAVLQGSTVLVHGHSRVAIAILRKAAQAVRPWAVS